MKIEKNIYYMMLYIFDIQKEKQYPDDRKQELKRVEEMYADILVEGIKTEIKKGFNYEYKPVEELSGILKGKIIFNNTLNNNDNFDNKILCSYDEITINNKVNSIIKSTLQLLLESKIADTLKKDIKKTLLYYRDVDMIDINEIDWDIVINQHNNRYKMILIICKLLVINFKDDNKLKLNDYELDSYSKIYEEFVYAYYAKERPELKINRNAIKWNGNNEKHKMIPSMNPDIVLTKNNKTLIIDTKFYEKILSNFKKHNAKNLYQIFSYVKNKESEIDDKKHTVSGLLLFAKTEEYSEKKLTLNTHGVDIMIDTINLKCDFNSVKNQLNCIVDEYFV